MRLKDKVAIITGTASGMGRAATIMFAREGAMVVACDVNDEGGQETVRMAREAGGEASYVHCDVSKSAQVQEVVAFAVRTHGRLDILYNNAGISGPYGSCVETEEEEWDRTLAINLKSVYLFCKYAVPEMIKQPASSVINTASAAALRGQRNREFSIEAYTASKGGVVAMTRTLAGAFGKYGLRANVICPGPTDTGMTAPIHAMSERREAVIKRVPLGRIARPEEIAAVALFLASDEASFVTAATIPVDGGSSQTNG